MDSNGKQRPPTRKGAATSISDGNHSKASVHRPDGADRTYMTALLRARREYPEALQALKREASARQWEVVRRRVARPIDNTTDPEVNVQIRELIRRCKARGRGEAVGTVSQSANMNRGTLPYWWAA